MRNHRVARSESGFAMLFVFLLAACVAISLYMELPRVVFEAQRGREELLIARGEQYKRAIQLYYRAMRMYPPTLEALENTNNRRFLRKRYKDPMTGEDEWRLIHAGPAGILTDSLVTTPPGQKAADDSATASVEAPTPLWLQRRPSDGGTPLDSMQSSLEEPVSEPRQEVTPVSEQRVAAYQLPASGQPSPTQEPALVQPVAEPREQAAVVSMSGQAPAPEPGTDPTQPPSPTQATRAAGSFGQASPVGPPGTPAGSPVGGILDQLLRSPNPQGMAMTASMRTSGGQQIGGGIAGVASKLEAEGIKVYGDRTKYNEWEFVYDPRQDRNARGQTGSQQTGTQDQGTRTPPRQR